MTDNATTEFPLSDLPRRVEKFGFILGRQRVRFREQDPVNIDAAELVGHLHDLLEASGYTGHRPEVFLSRIVFCLFADDTGIFEPKDSLWDFLETRTAPDATSAPGSRSFFDVLNTREDARQTTHYPDLARFPHVNGHLFEAYFPPPRLRRGHARGAAEPAIFGALFQSVMDPAERRRMGAHYTSERPLRTAPHWLDLGSLVLLGVASAAPQIDRLLFPALPGLGEAARPDVIGSGRPSGA